MYKDFSDYGWDAESYCHKIYAGRDKTNEFPVTITTWQSVYKLERSFFEDYNVVIVTGNSLVFSFPAYIR